MEKYMDPKRPFKCDVCIESFTQKNILLVHFNSVSHLHKMKKVLKEQQENPNNLTPQSDKGSPTSSPTGGPGSTLMSVLGSLNAKKQLEPDNEVKPYKCNICRVAYAQGSTLDIHIRSVLHHTRANKLQELVMTGHVDLNKPLIEHPNHEEAQAGLDLFSPKSLGSGGSPVQQKTPTSKEGSRSPGPISSTPKSLAEMFDKVEEESPTKEDSSISPIQQQSTDINSSSPSSNSDSLASSSAADGKKSSHVLKSLLQNYGFELVMQFNEKHQKRKVEQAGNDKEEAMETKEDDETAAAVVPASTTPTAKDKESTPELKKSKCPMCDQQFSSIWVLKAHTEEEHKVVVPQEFVQKYVDELKSNSSCEDKEGGKMMDDVITVENSAATNNLEDIAEESHDEKEEESAKEAAGRSGASSKEPTDLNPFQQAFKAFKEHEAKLLGNASMKSMNIHPPLIPGMLPQGLEPLSAAMQMHGANPDLSSTSPFERQIFSKLGIDPDVVRQAGLDPKLLIHLAMVDPKSAMDPRMLAMFSTQSKELEFPNQKMMQLAMENKLGLLKNGPPPPASFPGPEFFQQQFFEGAKRARTRITDDQLKILRANFDINNSPSEEQINSLSLKTSLPPKVIKHWFRNTLFKERQKNKDSPYNFNNPPSTMLNLEEYEKTGEPKVTPLNPEEQKQYRKENAKSKEKEERTGGAAQGWNFMSCSHCQELYQ